MKNNKNKKGFHWSDWRPKPTQLQFFMFYVIGIPLSIITLTILTLIK